MKRKIHIELLATAVFSILLTLLCVLFVFYGVYQKQVIGCTCHEKYAYL